MTPVFIIWILSSLIILDFLFTQWLEYLNNTAINQPIPSVLQDIYDTEKHKKSIAYHQVNYHYQLLTSGFNTIIILSLLLFGGFAYLNDFVCSITNNNIFQTLLFFGLLFLIYDLLNLPFSVYDTFVIEERFGFNKTSPKTFILDHLKSWLLTILIGGSIFYLILWFYTTSPNRFWLYAWILTSGFSIFMAMFYSSLIVPLFNKQTPLENGSLRQKIEAFSQNADFSLTNIFVIDNSKRSTKANAYFSGLGKQKRIVLFDTLLQQLSEDEIVAVLAHEIGHYKRKHIIKSLILGVLQTGILFYLFSLFAHSTLLSQALLTSPFGYQANTFASGTAVFHLNIIVFALLFSPISMLINLITNKFSRKNEYEADAFAAQHNLSEYLISGLKKLSKNNLSHLTPHRFYVAVNYSHPTLLQRIEKLRKP